MAADSRPYSTGADIVCHNDPAGWNLVVGPERWALIDWDVAGPRPAIWDVAYLVRGMVPLTDDEGASLGWPTPPDVLHRLDVIAGGYGLSPTDRDRLPAVVVARIESSYRAMERRAAAGEQPWSDLFAGGHGRTWKAVLDLARRVLL
jgi:thiamine kinase-like enzyme